MLAGTKLSPSIKLDVGSVEKMTEVLLGVLQGERKLYSVLLLQIESYFKCHDAVKLKSLFTSLNEAVSIINEPHHNEIITVILQRFTWLYEQPLIDVFTGFLLNLISAHGNLITGCFRHLIRKFQFQETKTLYTSNSSPLNGTPLTGSTIVNSSSSTSLSQIAKFGALKRSNSTMAVPTQSSLITQNSVEVDDMEVIPSYNLVSSRIHVVFQRLLSLVPSSLINLTNALALSFPHHRFEALDLKLFTQNLLEIAKYCPSIRDKIFEIIIDKSIQMDALIVLEETPDEEELLFDVELEKSSQKTEPHKEMAKKLDGLMEVIFSYIDEVSLTQDNSAFLQLLQVFDMKILPTFKAKYVQFIIFYYCTKDPANSAQFVGYLANRLGDVSTHTLTRQACASYIGSFLSRANFVDDDLFWKAIGFMVDWGQQYLDRNIKLKMPDVDCHSLFYSVVQSIIYSICYYNDRKPVPRIIYDRYDIDRLITTPLNPLKFCSQDVVHIFKSITERMNISTVSQIIERNKGIKLPSRGSLGGNNHLETFFPFDPYLLKNSSPKINPYYYTWSNTREKEQLQLNADDSFTQSQSNPINMSHTSSFSIGSPMTSESYNSFNPDDSETPVDISGMSLEDTNPHVDTQFFYPHAVEV